MNITGITLLQILFERESTVSQFLSETMLKQIIILSHHPLHKTFSATLEQFFTNTAQLLQKGVYTENPPFKEWQEQFQAFSKKWQDFFKP